MEKPPICDNWIHSLSIFEDPGNVYQQESLDRYGVKQCTKSQVNDCWELVGKSTCVAMIHKLQHHSPIIHIETPSTW